MAWPVPHGTTPPLRRPIYATLLFFLPFIVCNSGPLCVANTCYVSNLIRRTVQRGGLPVLSRIVSDSASTAPPAISHDTASLLVIVDNDIP
jgi:hypothetical protein